MAASMAGNASSPLTSGSIWLPAISGWATTRLTTRASILQMFRAVVFRFAEIFRDRPAEGFMDAELDGAAADAVDAEREVKTAGRTAAAAR